jgi:hypothetical protein
MARDALVFTEQGHVPHVGQVLGRINTHLHNILEGGTTTGLGSQRGGMDECHEPGEPIPCDK